LKIHREKSKGGLSAALQISCSEISTEMSVKTGKGTAKDLPKKQSGGRKAHCIRCYA